MWVALLASYTGGAGRGGRTIRRSKRKKCSCIHTSNNPAESNQVSGGSTAGREKKERRGEKQTTVCVCVRAVYDMQYDRNVVIQPSVRVAYEQLILSIHAPARSIPSVRANHR